MDMLKHIVAQTSLPPFSETSLYEYVLASNGLFIRSHREGLEALIPVISFGGTEIKGLISATPYVHLEQKVPFALVEAMLSKINSAYPNEILFWLTYGTSGWDLYIPEQTSSAGRVEPLDPEHPAGAIALMDAHSHGAFAAHFSTTDDADETGFRLYVCFGRKGSEVCARIGIFGHMWEIPSNWIMELPEGINDLKHKEAVDED